MQRFRVSCEWSRQIAHIDYYWDTYRGGRRISRDHAPMCWRWFHRYEFEHLLARTGLKTLRLHGDFDGSDFRADSDDLIFVVVRN